MKKELSYELKYNSCEVCGKKPARASIYEYKRKDKDPELPILHYSCLNHILDLYDKTKHRFVLISNC
jgi:uncharacterized protein YuzB (UPF0349 family)